MMLTVIFLLPFLADYTKALYDGKSSVVELTPANFNSRVMDSESIWVVEFFAPWCGHCKALVSEYLKAAEALKGVVKIGAVNADEHKSLGGQYGVRGFPTIKVFGRNKNNPQDYNGPRTAQGIVDAAFKELRNTVDERMGGKSSSGSGGGGSKSKKANSEDIIELTDSNFKDLVLESNDMWLVEFYAPWCGHCQKLAPEWAEAATDLKGKVKVGALDATVHTIMASKYDIKGFPSIKFFPAGPKDGSAEDYDGARTAKEIVTWAQNKVTENTPPPEVFEVTSEDVLKEACDKHPLCVISILPNILDCQSECRHNYLQILKEVGNRYRKTGWAWVWAEAFAQQELEDSLGIGGFGYPAMTVINARKMKYSVLRGPFSFDGISEFIRSVSMGRGSSAPVKGGNLPTIAKTEPWDGKDGELPVEEDIDLSDVTFDDEPAHSEL